MLGVLRAAASPRRFGLGFRAKVRLDATAVDFDSKQDAEAARTGGAPGARGQCVLRIRGCVVDTPG